MSIIAHRASTGDYHRLAWPPDWWLNATDMRAQFPEHAEDLAEMVLVLTSVIRRLKSAAGMTDD